MAQTLREKLHWDTRIGQITDDDRRYLMLRADVLMGVFRNLEPQARSTALAALADSVRASGGRSAQAYFAALGNDVRQLLLTMQAYAAELGWGAWSFQEHNGNWELLVHNSPFAAGFGPSEQPVCHAIAGMLAAVGELITGSPTTVQESSCAAQGCAHCTFRLHTS